MSELELPDAFAEWCRTLPSNALKRLSIHELRQIWELTLADKQRIAELEADLSRLSRLASEQAEDEGLWFLAETAAEAYLQRELRKLHAAIEREVVSDE
jgi:ribosomal protein RSM22 (predicted rRNA methylase)